MSGSSRGGVTDSGVNSYDLSAQDRKRLNILYSHMQPPGPFQVLGVRVFTDARRKILSLLFAELLIEGTHPAVDGHKLSRKPGSYPALVVESLEARNQTNEADKPLSLKLS